MNRKKENPVLKKYQAFSINDAITLYKQGGCYCFCYLPSGEEINLYTLEGVKFEYSRHNQGIKYDIDTIRNISALCRGNKKYILTKHNRFRTIACGCFYCNSFFPSHAIQKWVDRKGTTALCPICEINAVLPGSVVKLSPELLAQLCNRGFNPKYGISGKVFDKRDDMLNAIIEKLTTRELTLLGQYSRQIRFKVKRRKENAKRNLQKTLT